MKKESQLGVFSMFASFTLLALLAWKCEVFGVISQEMVMLLTGRVREIAVNNTSFLLMFPILIGIVVIELPFTCLSAVLTTKVLGRGKQHAVGELLKNMTDGNHFFNFFIAVLAEELIARWFFLGVLVKIPVLSGQIAFYTLFLLGNMIWALIHLRNFKNSDDRHILRVLPQFVAGIFFTYVFVKFGLFAVIITHFASNALLFAAHKVQRFNGIDAMIIGYATLCSIVSFALMRKPLTDIAPWFADTPTFKLQGWGFWDYVCFDAFITFTISALLGILLYDRGEAGRKSDQKIGILGYIIVIPLVMGILYGIYAILGFFFTDVPYRILALAVTFSFIHRSASGSAISKTFWSSLPNTYITMCILQALGFWYGAGWLSITTLFNVPKFILDKWDD